jgi:hypothetical protein
MPVLEGDDVHICFLSQMLIFMDFRQHHTCLQPVILKTDVRTGLGVGGQDGQKGKA